MSAAFDTFAPGVRSTATQGASPGVRSTAQAGIALEIDRKRARLSMADLARAAGVDHRHLRRLERGIAPMTAAMETKLRDALRRGPGDIRRKEDRAREGLFGLAVARLAGHFGVTPERARTQWARAGQASADPEWLAAARLRCAALYLMHTACGIDQPRLGRLAGVTKQAVHKAVRDIEARRDDDAALDALLDAIEADMRGM